MLLAIYASIINILIEVRNLASVGAFIIVVALNKDRFRLFECTHLYGFNFAVYGRQQALTSR